MIRVVVASLFIVTAASAAVTIIVRPDGTTPASGDAYVRAAAPGSNFGGAGALVVSGNGSANTKGEFDSVVKFDLGLVVSSFNATFGAGQWTVDSVALELTSALPFNPAFNSNAAGTIAVQWLSDDSWAESSVTWNSLTSLVNAGVQSMGTFSYNGASAETSDYALISASGFISDLQSGGLVSLLLSAADPDVSMTMNSRNFTTTASRPALVITASPEPSQTMLLMFGVGVLGFRRRGS